MDSAQGDMGGLVSAFAFFQCGEPITIPRRQTIQDKSSTMSLSCGFRILVQNVKENVRAVMCCMRGIGKETDDTHCVGTLLQNQNH